MSTVVIGFDGPYTMEQGESAFATPSCIERQRAIELEGNVLSQINCNTGCSHHLVIYGPSSILRARIIPAVADVLSRFPSLTVEFKLGDTVSALGLLKRGETDIAVMQPHEVTSELDSKKLTSERYVLVAPLSWKERDLEDIIRTERIIDFDPSDTMTHLWLQKFGLKGKERHDRHFVNNTDALVDLVARELGYSVLTRELAEIIVERENSITILAERRQLNYPVALAWYARPQESAYFKALIKSIR